MCNLHQWIPRWWGKAHPPIVQPVRTQINIDLDTIARNIWLPYNIDFIQESGDLSEKPVELDPAAIDDPEIIKEIRLSKEIEQAQLQAEQPPAPSTPSLPTKPNVVMQLVESIDVRPKLNLPVQAEGSSEIIRELILPNENILRTQGVLTQTLELARVIEQKGTCPSIVTIAPEKDSEYADLWAIRNTLAQVSMANHTLRVSQIALRLVREQYRDHQLLVPKVLITALGHDLGKIPDFRAAGIYSMGDHPMMSAVKLQEIFKGTDLPWFHEVIEAIKSHHRTSKEPLDVLLKRADGEARQYELAATKGNLVVKPWDEWCTVPEILQLIEPRINLLGRGNKWAALAMKDIVYVVPEVLLEAARHLSESKGVVDITLIRQSDYEGALRKMVAQFRDAHLLALDVGDGFYGRKFAIQTPKTGGVRRSYLVPIKIGAFAVSPGELEARKRGVLKIVSDVRLESA
ncbi:MAG: HD domain-containing protein [Nitrospira sp.]|nr:HD domain-containing protein [Nitrospira sp.]